MCQHAARDARSTRTSAVLRAGWGGDAGAGRRTASPARHHSHGHGDLALADDVAEVPVGDLLAAQRTWAVVDSPWVTMVDRDRYAGCLRAFPGAGSPLVLSTHLPPARDCSAELLDVLAAAPDVPPFVGPEPAALEAMLAGFEPASPAAKDEAVPAPT